MLKRYKGAISYFDFFEIIDDDIWILYRLEVEAINRELKEINKSNGGGTNVPEPDAPEEDQRALDIINGILD